jgi:hypothetical protein
MSCPSGNLINVTNVFYGRANTVTCFPNSFCTAIAGCGVMQDTKCSSTTALSTVQTQCNQKQTCRINIDAGAAMGGDPCPQTLKYATFDYSCI